MGKESSNLIKSKRHRKLNAPLTQSALEKIMLKLFSKRNNFGEIDFDDLYQDLQANGIVTIKDFTRLMKKHRKRLRQIDRQKLDSFEIKFFIKEYGEKAVQDKIRRQYWYALAGLVRIALELEFDK